MDINDNAKRFWSLIGSLGLGSFGLGIGVGGLRNMAAYDQDPLSKSPVLVKKIDLARPSEKDEDDGKQKQGSTKTASFLDWLVGNYSKGIIDHPLAMVAMPAATIGGVYGGLSLSDKLYRDNRTSELDKRLSQAEKEFEQAVAKPERDKTSSQLQEDLDYLFRTYSEDTGQEKTSAESEYVSSSDLLCKLAGGKSLLDGVISVVDMVSTVGRATPSLVFGVGGLSALLSAKATYDLRESSKRKKNVRKAIESQQRSSLSGTPVFVSPAAITGKPQSGPGRDDA